MSLAIVSACEMASRSLVSFGKDLVEVLRGDWEGARRRKGQKGGVSTFLASCAAVVYGVLISSRAAVDLCFNAIRGSRQADGAPAMQKPAQLLSGAGVDLPVWRGVCHHGGRSVEGTQEGCEPSIA